jgi:hypothetical protein
MRSTRETRQPSRRRASQDPIFKLCRGTKNKSEQVQWCESFYPDDDSEAEPAAAQADAEVSRPRVDPVEESLWSLVPTPACRLLAYGHGARVRSGGSGLNTRLSAARCQEAQLWDGQRRDSWTNCGDVSMCRTDQEVEPYVLPSTPGVLPIGRRCVEEGCSFAWPSGKASTLRAPSGRALGLSVIKNTPYLEVGFPGDAQLARAGVPMAPSVAVEGIAAASMSTSEETQAPENLAWRLCPSGNLSCWSTAHARFPLCLGQGSAWARGRCWRGSSRNVGSNYRSGGC